MNTSATIELLLSGNDECLAEVLEWADTAEGVQAAPVAAGERGPFPALAGTVLAISVAAAALAKMIEAVSKLLAARKLPEVKLKLKGGGELHIKGNMTVKEIQSLCRSIRPK